MPEEGGIAGPEMVPGGIDSRGAGDRASPHGLGRLAAENPEQHVAHGHRRQRFLMHAWSENAPRASVGNAGQGDRKAFPRCLLK